MSLRSPSPLDLAARDPNFQARRQIRELIDRTLAYFGQHQAEHLTLIRAHLLDLLEARPSQVQSNNLRSAWSLLDKQADAFNRAFQAALQTALDQEARLLLPEAAGSGFRAEIRIDAQDSASLSLIDLSEVERMLLVDRVAQRFAGPYGASLSLLSQRLGVLLGLDKPGNPFRPEVFVRAFLQAWENSALDEQATEDLVQSLQPQHCVDLAPLYAELNALLEQAGIEAQTGHRIRRSEAAPAASRSAPAGAPLSGGEETPASPRSVPGGSESAGASSDWAGLAPAGRRMAAQARQFLRRLGWGSQDAADDTGGVTGVARSANVAADPEFMGYLGQLQADVDASASLAALQGQDPGSHNILRQMLERDEVRRAPELDRGTVDALAEVFDFVFADPAIPLQLKFVIGRLQIPVLRAAMIDRDFFLSPDHPARRLIDTLAQASIGWTPEKGEGDPLYQRVEATVKRVLTEFDDKLELFSDLLREFTDYLQAAERQVQVLIEPKVDQERAGESLEHALAQADEVIHARLSAVPPEAPLASFLLPFVTSQWREVMGKAWLSAPADTAPWESALMTLEQLIWSTQPKTGANQGRELVAALPDLVRRMNAGLDAIGWSGEERAEFTRRLIATHMAVIRVKSALKTDKVAAAREENVGKEALQDLDQRLATQASAAGDEFDALAQTFTRGLWFDFSVDKNSQHRCRLSWVSPKRTRMLFTNRDGFDAFVCSEREVAKLLRRGRLSVIDAEPIVSRALDRLMSEGESAQAAST